jgi:hypothetical protein
MLDEEDQNMEPGNDTQQQNVGAPSDSVEPGRQQFRSEPDQFRFERTYVQPAPTGGHVRLPEFWISDPHMWFAQAEAAFRRAGVMTSIIRYDYVLMKLPEEVLRSVRDLVQGVSDETTDAYEQLKYRLLSSYGMSKWQLAGRIIDFSVTPGSRPSTLLDGMMSLLPTGEQPGVLFMALFLKKLPQDVRDHLCSRNFDSVREMAVFADQLWDARGSLAYPIVAAISGKSPTRGRRRSKSPNRGGKRRQTPAPGGENLCYYHATYAEKAHKCRPPCTWQGNAIAAGTE